MARATITKQALISADLTSATVTFTAPTGAGANNGWSFTNSGSEILVIKNTDTTTKTLTKVVTGRVGGLLPADVTVTVPAASGGNPGYAFCVFPTDAYSGTASADISNVTGVTAGLLSAQL